MYKTFSYILTVLIACSISLHSQCADDAKNNDDDQKEMKESDDLDLQAECSILYKPCEGERCKGKLKLRAYWEVDRAVREHFGMVCTQEAMRSKEEIYRKKRIILELYCSVRDILQQSHNENGTLDKENVELMVDRMRVAYAMRGIPEYGRISDIYAEEMRGGPGKEWDFIKHVITNDDDDNQRRRWIFIESMRSKNAFVVDEETARNDLKKIKVDSD